jgi:hypothetical protein
MYSTASQSSLNLPKMGQLYPPNNASGSEVPLILSNQLPNKTRSVKRLSRKKEEEEQELNMDLIIGGMEEGYDGDEARNIQKVASRGGNMSFQDILASGPADQEEDPGPVGQGMWRGSEGVGWAMKRWR